MKYAIVALLALALGGVALAHAYLEASVPAAHSRHSVAPTEVSLLFSEPVEARFSLFKVYPLAVAPTLGERETALAARALMREVLERRDDQGVPITVQAEGRSSAQVSLVFEEALPPGSYVVMWRVLSIDTHTTQDFFVFHSFPED